MELCRSLDEARLRCIRNDALVTENLAPVAALSCTKLGGLLVISLVRLSTSMTDLVCDSRLFEDFDVPFEVCWSRVGRRNEGSDEGPGDSTIDGKTLWI